MSASTDTPLASPPSTTKSFSLVTLLSLILALIACLSIALIFWKGYQQQQQQQSYQQTISQLQNQVASAQQSIQQSLTQSQTKIDKALNQLNAGKVKADQQIALNSAMYLLRMANLALLINQDPSMAKQLLTQAQQRLKNYPNFDALRANLVNSEETLAAMPNLDINGLLMQIGSLKKTVMSLSNVPHMPKTNNVQKDVTTNKTVHKAAADWQTFWHWLKRFIIITKQDSPNDVLATPEHFSSVQDSVYLAFSTAQWAILHKNNAVYKHSLQAVIAQLQTIKTANPKAINQIIKQVNSLLNAAINPNYPSLSADISLAMQMQTELAATSIAPANNGDEQSAVAPTETISKIKGSGQPAQSAQPKTKAKTVATNEVLA